MSSRRTRSAVTFAILALFAVAVLGLVAGEPDRTDRAYELEQRLRCPVCKSVSIAESPSQSAEAMRTAVAQQVAAGRPDQEIVDYFRARFGDWVLLDPPSRGVTLPLWLLPVAAVVVGVVMLFTPRRRQPGGTLTAEQRDQAACDLRDLERQVAAGEIPDHVAADLRRRYESVVDSSADEEAGEEAGEEAEAVDGKRTPRVRLAVYVAAGAVVVLAAALVPAYVSSRPEGGAVTGNEVLAPGPDLPARPADFSAMSDTELADAVAANPTAIGMRLALAGRYVAAGAYDKATDHYGVALQQDPGNPEVLAGAGWLLFRTGKTEDGLRFVEQALLIAPESVNALWYKANILLEGRGDPSGALAVLRQLARRDDVPADLRNRVGDLITAAEQAGGK